MNHPRHSELIKVSDYADVYDHPHYDCELVTVIIVRSFVVSTLYRQTHRETVN